MERLLALKKFLQSYATGGNLLIVATVLAFIIANSPWSEIYFSWWNYPISLYIGEFNLFCPQWAHHEPHGVYQRCVDGSLLFYHWVGD